MKNEITQSVYDFLREYPPFTLLTKSTLKDISSQVIVKYLPPETIIFKIGEIPPRYFYMVNEGAIELQQGDGTIVEHCDQGDIFGIRPLLTDTPYVLTAMASEESILYIIKTDAFLPHLEIHNKVLAFLETNFAVGVENMYYRKQHQDLNTGFNAEIIKLDIEKVPIYCTLDHTIQDAAIIMAKQKIGSIIICHPDQKPIGIITDKDIRIKVVAGDISKNANVTKIMSSPVICVTPLMSIAELQMIMIKKRINHLVVTEDGTMHTRSLGVISGYDLLLQQADNPAILIKAIGKCTSAAQIKKIRDKTEKLIKKYIDNEAPITFITQIMSEINDEITKSCIQIAKNKLGHAEMGRIRFCWLALGSEGREEQVLPTDQDNAIIYQDDSDVLEIKSICLAFAHEVNTMLHEIGYEYCSAKMMASNPSWCQSTDEWKKTLEKWICNPGEDEILMSTIFFDFRPIFGDHSLSENLNTYISTLLDQQEMFLHFLAKNTLNNPPPLSFFRNFIVEKNGEHKHSFDIKLRAMMPLADLARLLVLSDQISGITNTCKRYLALAKAEPENAPLFQMAAEAYEILIRIRTTQGLQSGDSGRYLLPEALDKMSRLYLRNAFQPIGELQKMVKTRFQLGGIV